MEATESQTGCYRHLTGLGCYRWRENGEIQNLLILISIKRGEKHKGNKEEINVLDYSSNILGSRQSSLLLFPTLELREKGGEKIK